MNNALQPLSCGEWAAQTVDILQRRLEEEQEKLQQLQGITDGHFAVRDHAEKVVNDALSRLHKKGERISGLRDILNNHLVTRDEAQHAVNAGLNRIQRIFQGVLELEYIIKSYRLMRDQSEDAAEVRHATHQREILRLLRVIDGFQKEAERRRELVNQGVALEQVPQEPESTYEWDGAAIEDVDNNLTQLQKVQLQEAELVAQE